MTFAVDRHPSAAGGTLEDPLERTDDNPARLLQAIGALPRGPHRLPAGRYRLDVELSPGGRRAERELTVSESGAGATRRVRLELP